MTTKANYLITVLLIMLAACNKGTPEKPTTETVPEPPALKKITIPDPDSGEMRELSLCSTHPDSVRSDIPTCEIYRDKFVTENMTSLSLAVSRKPNNTLCCLTAQMQDYYGYQDCYNTKRQQCGSGYERVD